LSGDTRLLALKDFHERSEDLPDPEKLQGPESHLHCCAKNSECCDEGRIAKNVDLLLNLVVSNESPAHENSSDGNEEK